MEDESRAGLSLPTDRAAPDADLGPHGARAAPPEHIGQCVGGLYGWKHPGGDTCVRIENLGVWEMDFTEPRKLK